ncbi:transporter [Pelomonas sp. SE-A7]|uniref:transporter n=1 Tax=Pelomonas sp. SE-A7 TaxID=3054953 RepID=UPI00259CE218|nr:transporter [Pelomonas sp. SE-A7]MDM4766855.1 transporter [Pelomonas sp. SE-A7]
MNDVSRAGGSYGADENGLICGYLFLPGQAAQEMASEAAAARLRGATADGGYVWLHINLSHARAEPWLRRELGLPEEFFEALAAGSRSSRIEREGDALFAVINDISFDFSFDIDDLATLWILVRQGLLLSSRRQPLRSVDRLRAEVKRGEQPASPVALLDQLLRDQAEELLKIVRRATERIDDIEDAVLAGQALRHGGELSQLRRLMVRLQRWLAPEPSALMRMLANPPAWVPPADTERLRQASEDFSVVLRDIASLQERIKLLQEEAGTRVAEENNRSLFTLTMVTVLALPINLIAGLMGMNVGGIPMAEHAHGFWLVLLLIALITALLGWLVWRSVRRRD